MPQGYVGTANNPLSDVYSEFWEFTGYTSDPAHTEGDLWLRTDLSSGDKIAMLRFDNGNSIVDIPVYATSTDPNDTSIKKVARIDTPNGVGWFPVLESGGTYSYLGYQHAGARHGVHDSLSPVPGGEDLHARYDWSQASGTSSVADQTGNGYDLSGSYTGPTATINGMQAGTFDGIDDYLSATFSELPQPNMIFAVAAAQADDTSSLIDGTTSNGRNQIVLDVGDWGIFAGNTPVSGSDADQNPHVLSALFDGSSSYMRVDGTQDLSGDPGSDGLNGISVGEYPIGDDHGAWNVGEILVYPQDKSGIQTDVEQYLADKWGIAV